MTSSFIVLNQFRLNLKKLIFAYVIYRHLIHAESGEQAEEVLINWGQSPGKK
jgi:hypothetical protein